MSGALGTALREERYSVGFGKRKHLFACYKKFIVPMKQTICGGQNGVTKLFSPLMKATKQAFVFFSMTILIYNSREFIQTRGEVHYLRHQSERKTLTLTLAKK